MLSSLPKVRYIKIHHFVVRDILICKEKPSATTKRISLEALNLAMCMTAITMSWIDYWVNTNSKD
jgi:hypothetical protein